mmetsp:Transcript_13561/g.26801  ORF Transcript_13561/g.26801 Transcript_13561/m.26801 type:complete len:124 (-) Transcript_13561:310-681(-)
MPSNTALAQAAGAAPRTHADSARLQEVVSGEGGSTGGKDQEGALWLWSSDMARIKERARLQSVLRSRALSTECIVAWSTNGSITVGGSGGSHGCGGGVGVGVVESGGVKISEEKRDKVEGSPE